MNDKWFLKKTMILENTRFVHICNGLEKFGDVSSLLGEANGDLIIENRNEHY